jgi:hypothetical protein
MNGKSSMTLLLLISIYVLFFRYYHDYQVAPSGYGVPIFGGSYIHQRGNISGIHWFAYDYTAYCAAESMGSRLSKN